MSRKKKSKISSGLKSFVLCVADGMRHVKRYILKNFFWIIAGLVLTGVFMKIAYTERGYMAYGGEWLTLPLVLMVVEIVRNMNDILRDLFEMEGNYEPRRNSRNLDRF